MILAQTCYRTQDIEFLAIVEIFETLQRYLKDCKHKVFILINHNNICCFLNTKSLSFYHII